MAYMKAFVEWWGREDVLFVSAVFPAAMAWISYESVFAGVVTFAFAYAAVVGAYEYVAHKKSWPHTALADMTFSLWRTYVSR